MQLNIVPRISIVLFSIHYFYYSTFFLSTLKKKEEYIGIVEKVLKINSKSCARGFQMFGGWD